MTAVVVHRNRSAAFQFHHLPLRITTLTVLLTATLILSLLHQCTSIEIDRTFLSGAADTTQQFQYHINNNSNNPRIVTADGSSTSSREANSESTILFTRHHLVCFHRGGNKNPYAPTIVQGREKCCNELYRNGLLQRDDRKYCFGHVAMVPISTRGSVGGGMLGRVAPAYYLALDKEEKITTDDGKKMSSSKYNQNRQLKVYEDKERESFRDGYKGVGAFSPFHLTDFMSNGMSNGKSNDNDNGVATTTTTVLPLRGCVEGTLSKDGGMARSFHQRMHLSLDDNSWIIDDAAPTTTTAAAETNYRMNINATIFLPITESVFIDGDDPFIVAYESGSREGVSCKVSIDSGIMAIRGTSSSVCNIQFLHPETIDIEQPAFASRQYIVAYQISAMVDFSIGSTNTVVVLEGNRKGLEVVVDYGTTLHIRYPSPILSNNEADDTESATNGLVPIVIQQPSLYAASMKLVGEGNNESSNTANYYVLQTTEDNFLVPPEPIIIHEAAGLDSDYWWVTIITMSSALIGGLVLMKSLDNVSIWC